MLVCIITRLKEQHEYDARQIIIIDGLAWQSADGQHKLEFRACMQQLSHQCSGTWAAAGEPEAGVWVEDALPPATGLLLARGLADAGEERARGLPRSEVEVRTNRLPLGVLLGAPASGGLPDWLEPERLMERESFDGGEAT